MGAEVFRWGPDGGLDEPPGPTLPPGAEDAVPLAGPATLEMAQRAKEAAGLADPSRDYRHSGRPDVSGLAEGLGLR